MKKELERLMKLAGTSKFEPALNRLHKKYSGSPTAKKEITAFIKAGISTSGKRIENLEKEINIREQMQEISEKVSLSYIAKTYFNKM